MYQYHVPPRRRPKNDNGYFEILAQAVFQAGFSWKVVRSKWIHFRPAFAGFDIKKVARFTSGDIARLMRDERLIRNGAKITAVVENARIVQELQKEHGSFKNFIISLRRFSYPKKRDLFAKKFRWIGPTAAYYFFWCVGEKVPEWEERNL